MIQNWEKNQSIKEDLEVIQMLKLVNKYIKSGSIKMFKDVKENTEYEKINT